MKLLYLLLPVLTFIFLPINIAERLKPGDPYLFVSLIVISKVFFDKRSDLIKHLSQIKVPLSMLLLSYLISSTFSYIPLESLKFTIRFFLFILYGVSASLLLKNLREIKLFLNFIFSLGLITGFHAFYQIKNPPPVIQGISVLEGLSNVRVFATFFNANIYAEFLVLMIIIGVCLFFLTKKLASRIFYAIATAFLSILLFYTYSRGSLLALLAGVLFFFLFFSFRLTLPIIVASSSISLMIPGFFERIVKTITFQDSSQFVRLRIWSTAFGTIDSLRKFLLGSGPYTFKTEVMDYVRKAPERFFGYFSFQPHNIYLMWLVEGGIFMLLAWLYFFAVFYWYGLRIISSAENNDVRIISIAILSSLTAFLINGITETVFYHYQVVPFIFLFFGILLRIASSTKEGELP